MNKISQNRLKHALEYNPTTGIFIWRNISKYHSEKNNKIAGCILESRNKKYLIIRIDRKDYKAHRLAWLYVHGRMPKIIDHINGESLDNRIINLRECDKYQNAQNHNGNINKSNLPCGVRKVSSGKYVARITANTIKIHIGTYSTIREAHMAYIEKRLELHDAPCIEGDK